MGVLKNIFQQTPPIGNGVLLLRRCAILPNSKFSCRNIRFHLTLIWTNSLNSSLQTRLQTKWSNLKGNPIVWFYLKHTAFCLSASGNKSISFLVLISILQFLKPKIMKKATQVLLLILVAISTFAQVTLNDVTLPARIKKDNTELILNGGGFVRSLSSKYM